MDQERKKVLLVEDDNNLRVLLADQLAGVFAVLQAEDGEEAVTKVVDNRPHIILLDLMLPKLDGFRVLERIRSYPDKQIAGTRVVVLSNLWSQKDILQVQGLKVDDYFVKANTKVEDVVRKIQEISSQV